MDEPSFHPFSRLQPELRRIIFLMATETRIVHIKTKSLVELTEQEQQDGVSPFDAFASRVAPWNLTVDPKMAHFAQDWRSSIQLRPTPPRSSWNFRPRNPGSAIQTMLIAFGFTTTKSRRLPWTPTAECPDLPPHLLYADPLAAWKMTRPHYLFSNAPIPPLLHTCFESREVLMRHGYQLAFGTRTAAPRTWFCFHRDVLYLAKLHQQWSSAPIHNRANDRYREDSDLGVWDVDPEDLTRVRRLALDNVQFSPGGFSDTSRILRACGNVVELFGVQRRLDDYMLNNILEGWRSHPIAAGENRYTSTRFAYERQEIDRLREEVGSDKDFYQPLSGVVFDFIVWEQTGQAVDLGGPQESLEIRRNRMIDELLDQKVEAECIGWNLSHENRMDMLGKGDEGTGGEVKTWKVPLVRHAVIGTRNGVDALYRARGRLRRWRREEGSLTPWDKLSSRHRWDLLDNGPSDEAYLTCWRR